MSNPRSRLVTFVPLAIRIWWVPLALLAACAPTGGVGAGRDISAADTPDAGIAPPPTATRAERCDDGQDDDDDGRVDEGCSCEIGESQACWPGKASSRGNGPCIDGGQTCVRDGEFASWGPCLGMILPRDEESVCVPDECAASEFGEGCFDGSDEDCDGLIDCDDPDCATEPGCAPPPPPRLPDDGVNGCRCRPGATRYCHVDVLCDWGSQVCQPDGSWGACGFSTAPPGCGYGTDSDWESDGLYDARCCVAQGFCCDNQHHDYTLYDPSQPVHASIGNCGSVCAN